MGKRMARGTELLVSKRSTSLKTRHHVNKVTKKKRRRESIRHLQKAEGREKKRHGPCQKLDFTEKKIT